MYITYSFIQIFNKSSIYTNRYTKSWYINDAIHYDMRIIYIFTPIKCSGRPPQARIQSKALGGANFKLQ